MSNATTTAAQSATAFATPAANWITVRDGLGRPHLEMRWSLPTQAAPAVPQRHAA